jgi:hypothetical protein
MAELMFLDTGALLRVAQVHKFFKPTRLGVVLFTHALLAAAYREPPLPRPTARL